jgi:hypothetical protein
MRIGKGLETVRETCPIPYISQKERKGKERGDDRIYDADII